MTDKEENDIYITTSKFDKLFLDFKYYNLNDTSNLTLSKHNILDEMKQVYDFTINDHIKNIDAKELLLKDTLRLHQYVSKNLTQDVVINNFKSEYSFENVTLDVFTKHLNKSDLIKEKIYSESTGNKRYDIIIPKIELKNIDSYLFEKYGIKLIKRKVEIETLSLELHSN